MSILINPADTFPISVSIGQIPNTRPSKCYAWIAPDPKGSAVPVNLVDILKTATISTVTFHFKDIDSRTNALIIDSAVDIVGTNVHINGAALRHARLLQTLVKWDLTDSKGNPIPVNPDNINALHRSVSEVLNDELDKLQDSF